MVTKKLKIKNRYGLHARPSVLIASTARKFKSEVTLIHGKNKANARNVIEILALSADVNAFIILKIKGSDERLAAKAIEDIFNNKFKDVY